MYSIKIMRDTEITLKEATDITILTEDNGGDELKAHIADCDIKAANAGATDNQGRPVVHSNMIAALFYDNNTSYLYEGDHCYITNQNNKTVFQI